jgi:hypothetical protein
MNNPTAAELLADSKIEKESNKRLKHDDNTIHVPIKHIKKLNEKFVNYLHAPLTDSQCNSVISKAVGKELLKGNASLTLKLNQIVNDKIEVVSIVSNKINQVIATRLDDILDNTDGADLLDRMTKVVFISSKAQDDVMKFKEMKLLQETVQTYTDKYEADTELGEKSKDMEPILGAISENPSVRHRLAEIIGFMGHRTEVIKVEPEEFEDMTENLDELIEEDLRRG